MKSISAFTCATSLLIGCLSAVVHAEKVIELSSRGGNSTQSKSTLFMLESNPASTLTASKNHIARGALTTVYQAGYSGDFAVTLDANNEANAMTIINTANSGPDQISNIIIFKGGLDYQGTFSSANGSTVGNFFTQGISSTLTHALVTGKPIDIIKMDTWVYVQSLNKAFPVSDVVMSATTQ